MSKRIIARDSEVVVGVDTHVKSQVVAVEEGDRIVNRRTLRGTRQEWEDFLDQLPGCTLHVIYESGPSGFNLGDLLEELSVERDRQIHVHVAPPAMVPEAPAKKKVKTDRRDAEKLIRAFKSRSFRPVVVPDKKQRAERQLVRERERLMKDIARQKNRIHGMIKFHGIEYPVEKKWTQQWRSALLLRAKAKDETKHVRYSLKANLELLRAHETLLADVERRIRGLCRTGGRKELMRKLMRQPGIGMVAASIIATEVADFRAFDNSAAFASYTGLVSGARGSGEVMHLGPITKVGNRRLRWIFVECAWTWIRCDSQAKLVFEALRFRRGARRAIVAMARKLAVRVYHQVVNNAPTALVACKD